MYLIDTDILIWVLRKNKKYQGLVIKLAKKGALSISTATIAEIYQNVYPSELIKTEIVLADFQSIDVNPTVAKQAGLYWQKYSKNLQNLSIIDCIIAATANLNEVILVTLNKKHFPMKDIKLLDF
jgi:predicted nucleic acid-binding protein